MSIGIISRCKSEKRLFKRIKATEIDKGVFLYEIPRYKRDKKIQKAVDKAVCAIGRGKIIFTRDMKKWGAKWEREQNLFFEIAPKCANAVKNRFEIAEPFDLAIRERSSGDKTLSVIRKMIYQGKSIKILTENQDKAREIADILMEEFGAVVEIFPYNYRAKQGLTVDLDKESIEIFGKATAHTFEIQGNSYKLDLDLLSLFKAQGKDFNEIVIKSFFIGKNKLTLQEF